MLARVSRFLDALRDVCPAPADVLDLGCGSGEIARACAESGYRVHGVDMSPGMIEAARKGDSEGLVAFNVLAEPEPLQLPLARASFDAIVASSVFEYVASPAQCFAELHRVCRPGGWMLLTVPNVSHRVRRLEYFIKPVARLSRPLLSGAAKSWQEYLSLSRQRHSPAEWSRQLANSGWAARSTQGQDSALLMIVAQSC
jgi:ubiquinone/menaquinone biosynthesis C-methylase UbiE